LRQRSEASANEVALDSNVLLWTLEGSHELKSDLKRKIADPQNDVLISAASVWEIAIKQRLRKLHVPDNWLEAVAASDLAPLTIIFFMLSPQAGCLVITTIHSIECWWPRLRPRDWSW
jgi:PIN domain nuclease of toxin-antitoxin system